MFLIYFNRDLVLIFVICDPGSGHQGMKTAKKVTDTQEWFSMV